MLTQAQLDQMYLDEYAVNRRDAAERRVVNWIQGAVAILMLFMLFHNLIKKSK